MRTLVIGRSPFADIVVADASVASHHAEMVVTDDGRLYLTDCGANSGTWMKPASGGGDDWMPIRQAFVSADDTLRLGDHTARVSEILKTARSPEDRAEAAAVRGEGGDGGRRGAVRGRVERDPVTGEIIRRRP